VFQALRIAVNDELGNLERALPQTLNILETGGYLIVLSFHEGEDRIVKQFINHDTLGRLRSITKKPCIPTADEIANNPRARSAKLRIAQKIS
jgi:16S rRNA (cytosine1402-N4)-methyltransferase